MLPQLSDEAIALSAKQKEPFDRAKVIRIRAAENRANFEKHHKLLLQAEALSQVAKYLSGIDEPKNIHKAKTRYRKFMLDFGKPAYWQTYILQLEKALVE